jgi:hypothetical protein
MRAAGVRLAVLQQVKVTSSRTRYTRESPLIRTAPSTTAGDDVACGLSSTTHPACVWPSTADGTGPKAVAARAGPRDVPNVGTRPGCTAGTTRCDASAPVLACSRCSIPVHLELSHVSPSQSTHPGKLSAHRLHHDWHDWCASFVFVPHLAASPRVPKLPCERVPRDSSTTKSATRR